MTPMGGTVSWGTRGSALFVAAVLLAGCGRVTLGAPRPSAAHGEAKLVPVADLLIEPDRFPARYPAGELNAAEVRRALQDIGGVPGGSPVVPAACAPEPLAPEHTVAAQGIDAAATSVLLVAVTRPAPPLSARIDQLRACPSFTVGQGPRKSTVTVSMLPAPPVDADDGGAIDQTETTPDFVRRTLTFVAQIDDTRISATWLHEGAAVHPDTAALDAVFGDAVLKVRRGG
jgi:hypothetical protein